jgi:hypothetical protein
VSAAKLTGASPTEQAATGPTADDNKPESQHEETEESEELSRGSLSVQDLAELSTAEDDVDEQEEEDEKEDISLSTEESDGDSEFEFSDEEGVTADGYLPVASRKLSLMLGQAQDQAEEGDDWSALSSLAEDAVQGYATAQQVAPAAPPARAGSAAAAQVTAPVRRKATGKRGASATSSAEPTIPASRVSRKAPLPPATTAKSPRASVALSNAPPVAAFGGTGRRAPAPDMGRRVPLAKQSSAKGGAAEEK